MENKKTIYIYFALAIIIFGSMFFYSDKKGLEEETINNTIENVVNDIEVKIGENFEILLESNPTTGYSWVSDFDENYIEFVNKNFVQQEQNGDEQIVGAGGTEKFQFKTLKTGDTKINFYYLREWEIDVAPVDQKVFDVTIK
ncbi:MAG: putative secreted protein [Parcubacteria group bacterium Athens0714_16]|nr:MAG: putative secreted protein [Parcubacteria group bacterium Athens0714_16]